MRPSELVIDTRSGLFLNPRHERDIIGATCQALGKTIVKPAGRQCLCQLCLPQDILVRIVPRSFPIGCGYQVGKLRKRVFRAGPLMRGKKRLRNMAGLGLENRQLKRHQWIFRGLS